MPPKPKAKGRAPKKHQLCTALTENELLTDLVKKQWRVGKAIGSGGFGLIYLADEGSNATVKDSAQYVIKIEPEANGPLFCELAFYNRAAKAEYINDWSKAHKRSFVGVPKYIAQGRHAKNGENMRFMVMPRCGTDLHNLWTKAEKSFKRATVAKIAIQMIDSLEYIHSKEYVHADIKGSNILCDNKDPNKLFLVDYGLATKYSYEGEHKEFKPNPKKAHNGTIEYTSCDAHLGASPSRRGDIEILGFVLLQWVAGHLPWEDNLNDCNKVRDQKMKFMKDVKSAVKKLCPADTPDEITQLLVYAGDMEYHDDPNYEKMRNIFKAALKSFGVSLTSPLDFTSTSSEPVSKPSKKQPKPKARAKAKSSKPLQSKTNNFSLDESSETAESSDTPVRLGKRRSLDKKPIATKSSSSSDIEPRKTAKKSRELKKQDPVSSDEIDISSKDESEPSPPKRRKIAKKISDEDFKPSPKKTKVPRKRVSNRFTPAAAQKKAAQRKPKAKSPRSSSTAKSSSSPTPEDEVNGISSEGESAVKEDTTNGSDAESPEIPKEVKKKAKSNRYSMAPLHTQPVLTENDRLTGKYLGKHPVFQRKRKVNVPKANAETQTTPSLRRLKSRQ